MNSEVCLHLVKERSGILLPGEVSERHFWLLIEISGMHSEKVINALREHLVMGYPLFHRPRKHTSLRHSSCC
ncbi:PapB/FocB family fimbrial expression transcriptional regulator [Escherichia coli]|uniref:PapB/FocB family fimbrial expression transcriptional regulator n=1 Tax=Escherichia coli TaxID=562 RepID=UPI002379B36A|nr:PapB/FocB family fimbrial expression transcriptional regulator [Escherichia coli]